MEVCNAILSSEIICAMLYFLHKAFADKAGSSSIEIHYGKFHLVWKLNDKTKDK